MAFKQEMEVEERYCLTTEQNAVEPCWRRLPWDRGSIPRDSDCGEESRAEYTVVLRRDRHRFGMTDRQHCVQQEEASGSQSL